MSWRPIEREDCYVRDDQPFISLSTTRLSFSASFCRLAELTPNHRVSINIDDDSKRIGFEFHLINRDHSLRLYAAKPTKNTKSQVTTLSCSPNSLISACPWVKKLVFDDSLSSSDRKFEVLKDGKLWTISICPSFELSSPRSTMCETNTLTQFLIKPTDKGIYRYRLTKTNEIVYIGVGNIKQRLMSPDRVSWEFDTIEYSLIESKNIMEKWERFWLKKFKDSTGRLPIYNKLNGMNLSDDGDTD